MHIFHRHALARRTSGGALLVFGSVALAAALAACNPKEPSAPITDAGALTAITVTPPDSIAVGDTVDLDYDLTDASGNHVRNRADDLVWTSSDSTVATVDAGTLIAKAPGTTTITAAADGLQGQATVEIPGPPPPP